MSHTQEEVTAITAALSQLPFYGYLKPDELEKLVEGFEKAPWPRVRS